MAQSFLQRSLLHRPLCCLIVVQAVGATQIDDACISTGSHDVPVLLQSVANRSEAVKAAKSLQEAATIVAEEHVSEKKPVHKDAHHRLSHGSAHGHHSQLAISSTHRHKEAKHAAKAKLSRQAEGTDVWPFTSDDDMGSEASPREDMQIQSVGDVPPLEGRDPDTMRMTSLGDVPASSGGAVDENDPDTMQAMDAPNEEKTAKEAPGWVHGFTNSMGWGSPHDDDWNYNHDTQEDQEGSGSQASGVKPGSDLASDDSFLNHTAWSTAHPDNVRKYSHTDANGATHHYHAHTHRIKRIKKTLKEYRWQYHNKTYNYTAPSNDDPPSGPTGGGLVMTSCTTRQDCSREPSANNMAPVGTPCLFGVDPRDEGSHCIMDGTHEIASEYGWCYTTDDKVEWGLCSANCPVFGERKAINDRLTILGIKLQALLSKVKEMPDYCGEKGCKPKAAKAEGKKKKKAKLVETAHAKQRLRTRGSDDKRTREYEKIEKRVAMEKSESHKAISNLLNKAQKHRASRPL